MNKDNIIHFQPLDKSYNVRCLNGSAHRRQSRDIKHVTCEKCKNPRANKKFWELKKFELNHPKEYKRWLYKEHGIKTWPYSDYDN